MAITWEVKIDVLDLTTKTVSVMAIRTDSLDPTNPKTYVVPNRHINTTAEKTAIMNDIWAMRVAEVNRSVAIAALIGALETQAKANLEAREI